MANYNVNDYNLREILELLSLPEENVSKDDMIEKIDLLYERNLNNESIKNFSPI